jgi:hypothetical protein
VTAIAAVILCVKNEEYGSSPRKFRENVFAAPHQLKKETTEKQKAQQKC